MKKISTAILALSLLFLFAVAHAGGCVDDADADDFGVYFDLGGSWCNEAYVAAGDQVTAYLVMSRPDATAISGWSAGVGFFEAPLYPTAATIFGGGINSGTGLGEYIIALPSPMQTSPATVLLSVELVHFSYTGPVPVHGIGVTGSCEPSFIDATSGQVVQGRWATCGLTPQCILPDCRTAQPLAMINGPAPVAEEKVSWSTVKALYR